MNEKQIAEIGKMTADTVDVLLRTGTFTADELREVATNQLVGSGVFPALGAVVDETDKADEMDLGEEE